MCTILFAIVMSVSIKFAIIPALFKPETTSPAIETADTRHGWIKRYDNLGTLLPQPIAPISHTVLPQL